ncbi:hypothetical protein [Polaribacter sp. Asnod1-A03]|uniref:hypothetical protein n=1 Tax=Polaribacter sp. Asnod1-A03 TaxID=3160581 RepID=UPI00386FB5AE
MKKLILAMVFVFATGTMINAKSPNEEIITESIGGSCYDMANDTELNYCGSDGCNSGVWEAAYDACRGQFEKVE